MNMTDDLRKLLDERGVKWVDDDHGRNTFWGIGEGYTACAREALTGGETRLQVMASLTPAQAVEATLGRGMRQECNATERTYGSCRYSTDRGWCEETCRIEFRHMDWYCTRCGEMVGTSDPTSELCISGNAIELWNYCPNCGRKVKR